MMLRRSSNYNYWLLNFAAFATLLLVAASALPLTVPGPSRWLAIGLFTLFGVLLALYLYTEDRPLLVHLYLGAQTIIILALYTVEAQPGYEVQTLFFVLAAQAMLFLSIVPGSLWILLFSVVTVVGGVIFYGWDSVTHVLTVLGGYAFFGTFGAALRQANEARQESQRLLDELRHAHEQLQAYTTQAQQLAVAEERNRLAREMHDSLGHRLTVAVVQLEGARRLIPRQPERAAQMVDAMRTQIKQALAELRQVVSTLRFPADEVVPPESLATAVSQLAHTFQEATGLSVHLKLPDDLPPLSSAQRLALYRAAQESLTNVQRHAAASQAWLDLTLHNGDIVLTTADDGRGFPSPMADGRFGLEGLRERAEKLGGTLYLETAAAGGAQVRFRLPLSREESAHE